MLLSSNPSGSFNSVNSPINKLSDRTIVPIYTQQLTELLRNHLVNLVSLEKIKASPKFKLVAKDLNLESLLGEQMKNENSPG